LQEYLRAVLVESVARPPVADVIARARRGSSLRVHVWTLQSSSKLATLTAGERAARL
jgi:hypothetical protein